MFNGLPINSGAFLSMLQTTLVSVLALGMASSGDAYASDPTTLVANGHRVSIHSETGKVRFIGADSGRAVDLPSGVTVPLTALGAAWGYAHEYGELFGLGNPTQELSVARSKVVGKDREMVRFQQTYSGVPVIAGEIIVNLGMGRKMLSMSGEISPELSLATSPSITRREAEKIAIGSVAKNHMVDSSTLKAERAKLAVYDPRLLKPSVRLAHLVWETEVISSASLAIREYVLVDAQTGAVSLSFSRIHNAKDRRTYTAGWTDTLPGTLVCTEADPFCAAGDFDAATAHVYAGDTYDFYLAHHGRDAVDNLGSPIISTVHWYHPDVCPNAFWTPTQMQMVYCDGFSNADDIVGHELTHGVTSNESNLFYYYQSGAINESFSDIWGEFVDLGNMAGNDLSTVRWLIGEDLAMGAGRDMSDPTVFSHPDRMGSVYYHLLASDQGGVHINNGINNKAAYLLTDGDTFNGYTVLGLGIPKVADLYYEVQTSLLTTGSDYGDLNDALYQACQNLIGSGFLAADCTQVQLATLAVEMDQEPLFGFNPDAALCPAGQVVNNVAFSDNFELDPNPNWGVSQLVGTNSWSLIDAYATSGLLSVYAPDIETTSDTAVYMHTGVTVPTGGFLHFHHAFDFEAPNWDGGVAEYSTNGITWSDLGPLYLEGQNYNNLIATGWGNPLAGRWGFTASSHGFVSSRYDLSSLAGQTLQVRFRIGTDSSTAGPIGWVVDDVQIHSCAASAGQPDRIGVYRPSSRAFFLDLNGNNAWDGTPTDAAFGFGALGDEPITGDWNGDGTDEIGVYRPGSRAFFLDLNGNNAWDGAPTDAAFGFGALGDEPITGDWNGDGSDEIGVYRPTIRRFYLDLNGNRSWDGTPTDASFVFGAVADEPVSGDWNGDGANEIGVYRPAIRRFYLDLNGNRSWDGTPTDASFVFGAVGDEPITGDWNDDGADEVGVYRPGTRRFFEDVNGNGVWDGIPTDASFPFGASGDKPIVGMW